MTPSVTRSIFLVCPSVTRIYNSVTRTCNSVTRTCNSVARTCVLKHGTHECKDSHTRNVTADWLTILGTPKKTRTDVSRLSGMRAAAWASHNKEHQTAATKARRPNPEIASLYDRIFFAAPDEDDNDNDDDNDEGEGDDNEHDEPRGCDAPSDADRKRAQPPACIDASESHGCADACDGNAPSHFGWHVLLNKPSQSAHALVTLRGVDGVDGAEGKLPWLVADAAEELRDVGDGGGQGRARDRDVEGRQGAPHAIRIAKYNSGGEMLDTLGPLANRSDLRLHPDGKRLGDLGPLIHEPRAGWESAVGLLNTKEVVRHILGRDLLFDQESVACA
jgi:hypothetical protein